MTVSYFEFMQQKKKKKKKKKKKNYTGKSFLILEDVKVELFIYFA